MSLKGKPRGLEAGLSISDLAFAGVQDTAQCPERGHVRVQAGLVADGRLEEEPQEAVDPQGFCTRALQPAWICGRLTLLVKDPVQLPGLGLGALRELPRLVLQKRLDGPAAYAECTGLRQQGFDLLIEDAALQKGVHPVIGRDRDRVHLLPVCAAMRIVQCGCTTTRPLQMKSDKIATREKRREVAANEKRQGRYNGKAARSL
jgi:hypothetical protein